MNNYLRDIFQVEEKLRNAEKEVAAFDNGSDFTSDFEDVAAARAWFRRVQQFGHNMLRDLKEDALPAPGRPHERWLLYASADVSVNSGNGSIRCQLCNKCRASLSVVNGKDKKPDVKMPVLARANGLWHGPDPEE